VYGVVGQDGFGGGIFRGRRAPADSVYDALNALINDERQPFRRGGSAYKSSAAGEALLGLWDGHTIAGQRTVIWDDDSFQVLDVDDMTPTVLASDRFPAPFARAAALNGVVALPGTVAGSFSVLLYGGSRKTAAYATGTITGTAGSTTLTGVGTAWLANVDPGMIASVYGIPVESVTSDTVLKLASPPPESFSLSGASLQFAHVGTVRPGPVAADASPSSVFVAAVGSVPRLLVCNKHRVAFSEPGLPSVYLPGDVHELATGSEITGATAIGDSAVIFTTGGVWVISNMDFDALDAVGNVQHRVAQVSQDVVLWGDPGIAAFAGALVIPAIDDVYLMGLGGEPMSVSDGVRPLYRDYVEAGYKPGTGLVYRGHYFLPVLNGSNALVDVLVCRLDLRANNGNRRPAWTRWANHAAGGAYAMRTGVGAARQPKCFGLNGARVTDLTGCFDPDATRKQDADGTAHALSITTNDLDTGPGAQKHYVDGARVEYELVDAASDNPTAALSYAIGAEGASFASAGAAVRGGLEADGTDYSAWRIRKDASRIRLKFDTSGPAASAILRRLELEVEQAGW
jgi:hypothetical protein